MQLNNLHFHNTKNYLYSKPVKGLQGFGVGCRFAFNGQEKDDEVSGAGNTMSAEYWEYDSRLGRRWNIDPLPKIHESPYAVFANNPIYIIDKNGADSTIYVNFSGSGLTTKQQNKAVKQLRKVYEESGVKSLKVVVTSQTWTEVEDFLNSTDQFVDFYNEEDKNTGKTTKGSQHSQVNAFYKFNARLIGNFMAHESAHGFLERFYWPFSSPRIISNKDRHNLNSINIMWRGTDLKDKGFLNLNGDGPTIPMERFTKLDAEAIQKYLSSFPTNFIAQYYSHPSELLIKKDVKYYVDNRKEEKIR